MAGAPAALHSSSTSPSPSPSPLSHRQAADCRPRTSSICRLWLSHHHQHQTSSRLRMYATSASVRFDGGSISSSGPYCNYFCRYRKLGVSFAASSDDWASVGAGAAEPDPADKGWAHQASDSQAKAVLDEDVFESTAQSEKAPKAAEDDALKPDSSSKDESSEPGNKFMGVLRDTTEELKEHAVKARAALAVTAQETAAILAATAQQTAEKSKENLSYIAENAPDPIRGIADTALKAHSADTPKKFAKIHDFCLGIPYGTILVIGGLLLFILTGTTAPIRFGVMLGGILLALSVTSLSAWKEGKPTTTYIIGQGVVSAILALTQIRRFWEVNASFSAALFSLISAGMLGFYCYVLVAGGNPPSQKTRHASAV